jgi:hypothetical protein
MFDFRELPLLFAAPFAVSIVLVVVFWFWAPVWFCVTLTILVGLPSLFLIGHLVGSYLKDR